MLWPPGVINLNVTDSRPLARMLTSLCFDDLAYDDLGSRQGPPVNVFREHGTSLRDCNETI